MTSLGIHLSVSRIVRQSVPAILMALTVTGCGSDSTAPGGGALAGTWHLVSVNGFTAPVGTLSWTFTADGFVANSDDGDCVESGAYSLSGSQLTAVVTGFSGSGCGGEIGDTITATVTVTGDTLTAVLTDPDLGSATFIFRRA